MPVSSTTGLGTPLSSAASTPTNVGGLTFGSAAEDASIGEIEMIASATSSGVDTGDGDSGKGGIEDEAWDSVG